METKKSKELTPEQIRRRHAVLVKIGRLEQAKEMEKTIEMNSVRGAVDAVILNPANPFLSLYREYIHGNVTEAEFQMTICVAVCQDESKLRDFSYKTQPSKPDELMKKEAEVREKFSPDQWAEKIEQLQKKLSSKDNIRKYIKNADRIRSENKSNLWWLENWYEMQKEKSQLYASRLLAAIETHKVA